LGSRSTIRNVQYLENNEVIRRLRKSLIDVGRRRCGGRGCDRIATRADLYWNKFKHAIMYLFKRLLVGIGKFYDHV
jgi:hypothetical protein